MAGRTSPSLRPESRPARAGTFDTLAMPRHVGRVSAVVLVGLLTVAVASATAARADNPGTIRAVMTAQVAELQQESALNKCLAASPYKNTPCILKQSLRLAALDDREIKSITAAMDGSETACVRTVALQELAYLKLWKAGALALHTNQRKQAKRLFVKSLPIAAAQDKIEAGCFAEAAVP